MDFTTALIVGIHSTLCEMWDDVEEETPAQPEPAPAADAAPAGESASEATQEAKPEEAETPAPLNPMDSNESRRLVFKHWIRPKTSQYHYLYDYQTNYYDDVIRYLDRRNLGLPVERPRAQTWGERALRTYLSKSSSNYTTRTNKQDTKLLHEISIGAKFQRFHSKSRISRKYSHLGFNTISI
ncbi:hypothetical protein K1T71_000184 [Dendrolimus kikuchii]|uniref:Uncharacterized protein n=1 Tax=Dendrolimus kikuchii TaxID=765133 RepID=A0ACC1DIN4_9NEOP|nr:hypothetical protein K1T71_000184 [Dendrolimus kikuchii]